MRNRDRWIRWLWRWRRWWRGGRK